jgi:hypothetical protein
MALGSTQPLTEMSTRNISWGWRRPVRRADNLATFMCRLSCNLGASTSWNPQGLPRPVMEFLFFFTYLKSIGEVDDRGCQKWWKQEDCTSQYTPAARYLIWGKVITVANPHFRRREDVYVYIPLKCTSRICINCRTLVSMCRYGRKSTGYFVMFSVITNIYNKKTKGPTLMELFTATSEKFFFLTTRGVRCVHHGWYGTHRYDIQVLATHVSALVHRYSSLLEWSVPVGQWDNGGTNTYIARWTVIAD